MNPPEDPDQTLKGINAAELLARGLESDKAGTGNPMAWQPPTPEELAKLLPQYEIKKILGFGGMGAVYQGVQAILERSVAIKLMPTEFATDTEFIARFYREARMLARLQHPNIVTIYDFGQTPEGYLYFVMEFVNGTDLDRIVSSTSLTTEQALELTIQICDALHYAHSRGVIHRDIKPANVLITADGHAKLADFGLARPVRDDAGMLTHTKVVMGTPAYMAPEQKEGQADERADIYALGVMLYEMLTGKRPKGVFEPPSVKVRVDVRLDQVVIKAMQQEPERRYQHVSELKTDVEQIRDTPYEAAAPGSKAKAGPQPVRRAKSSQLRRFAWVAGIAVSLITINGMLVWTGVGQRTSSTEEIATQPAAKTAAVTSSPQSNDAKPVESAAPAKFTTTTANGQITITGYSGPGGHVNIPSTINGLPVVGIEGAFYGNDNVTGVTIPDGVTRIGGRAFLGTRLDSVKLPNSVTSIGYQAFTSSRLTSLVIPDSVTSIEQQAFCWCDRLTSVTIGNHVTHMGLWAFAGCTSLTGVTIPDNVISMDHVFGGCTSLATFTVSAQNAAYSSVDGVLFNKNQTTLIEYPGGKADRSYTIPSSVSSITNEAFGIANGAFGDSQTLSSVTIPASVTSIGDGAFSRCAGLASITVSAQNPAYRSVDGVLFNRAETTLVTYPAGKADDTVTIPGNVTRIGNHAFTFCTSLIGVAIPGSVTNIGNWAFGYCKKLTSVTIPSSITSIGNNAFSDCGSLTKAVFAGNAPSMGKDVFSYGAKDFAVNYTKGATGFSTPTWKNSSGDEYPAVVAATPAPAEVPAPAPNAVPPDFKTDLVSWWKADGNAQDAAGTSHGSLMNGGGFGPGKSGQAFSLHTPGAHVAFPASTAPVLGQNRFTIALWVKFAADASAGDFLASHGADNHDIWAFCSKAGRLQFHVLGEAGGRLGSAEFTPEAGKWRHLAVTRSGYMYRFYVDGFAVASESSPGKISAAAAALTLGKTEQGQFKGLLDDIRIYSRALSATDLKALSEAP